MRQQAITHRLRQTFNQRRDFVADHARHQPVAACFVYTIQQMQRQGEGDAIQRMPRLEAVAERASAILHLQGVGE